MRKIGTSLGSRSFKTQPWSPVNRISGTDQEFPSVGSNSQNFNDVIYGKPASKMSDIQSAYEENHTYQNEKQF